MRDQRCIVFRGNIFIRTLFTHTIGRITRDWSQPVLDSLSVFGERILPSRLPHRLHYRARLYQISVEPASAMRTLALSLIRSEETAPDTPIYSTPSCRCPCDHMRGCESHRPRGISYSRKHRAHFAWSIRERYDMRQCCKKIFTE